MAVNINIPSQVSQTITDGVTDKAPSENAVNDALALKADTADLGATAFSNDYNDLDNLPTIPSVTGFVPYTGATSDLDMGTHNITADHISLNVSPSGAGFNVGATQWNNTIGSSETLLKGGSVTLKNGVDLVARVVNKVSPNTTLTKAAYQAVKVSGAQGGRLAIGLAQGNTDLNSADTIGLVTETIATNQEGFIITVGQLLDINTTGSLQGETWADGDVLYLSPTTAGRLTNIKPTGATGHIVVIGYVEYAHATQGAIYVKIMNGWELDELHNVYINPSTLADNNLLQYDSSTSLWKNESLSTAGVQPTLQSGTNIKTINGTTLLGSGDITISSGLTIGTTPVTSGTIGRVFFQGTGDVVQQSSSLFWDNTNARLGVGATPSTAVRLDIRAQGALSTDIAFRVRNSADSITTLAANGLGHIETRVNNSFHFKTSVIGSTNTINKGDFGGYENGMVVGHGNTMNPNVNMYIFGNNNSNSTNGNGIIAGYNNTAVNGNCFGSSNSSKFGNVFGNANIGAGSVFGNNNNISEANGHGSSATIIGNFLTLPNTPSINNTIFFGSRASAGAPHASIHHNNLGIGGVIPNLTNYDLNARGVFYTQNGTAPTTLVADSFGMYSADITAGNAAPHFRTENGNVIKLYQQSSSGIITVGQLVTVLQNLGLLS